MNGRTHAWPVAWLMAIAAVTVVSAPVRGQSESVDENTFTYLDVFELEVAADPQISPDGSRIVYVRRGSDVMSDRARTSLWIVNYDGSGH